MSSLSFLAAGGIAALVCCGACGSGDPESICGSERPCVPEGTWVVSYEDPAGGGFFSDNTIRVDSAGNAEVIGETVPAGVGCNSDEPVPGELTTSAELLDDGCTLTANIEKDFCASGEENCDYRTVTLRFCDNGSTTVAVGSLRGCKCWSIGRPFCSADELFVTTRAEATRQP